MKDSRKRAATLPSFVILAALLFACAPALVERRGNDLIPKQAAPGKPEIYLRTSPDAAPLALELGTVLAEGGAVVHLGELALPASLAHVYVVALGEAANAEINGLAGRVSIGPTSLSLTAEPTQPLFLIRPPGPPPVEPTARPVWELRFDGLAHGFALSRDERHSLEEAVTLWDRDRAADE